MKVLVSYSHDSPAHSARVRAFAERLRKDKVQVIFDGFVPKQDPSQGWPKWSEQQATRSGRVLIVMTRSYRRCWDGENPSGMRLGATNEAVVLAQRVYKAGQHNAFCRVVVFDPSDTEFIPERLAGYRTYHAERDYPALLEWLGVEATDAPATAPATMQWPKSAKGFRFQLANRSVQFECFERILTGRESRRILLLSGPTNSGKTAFLEQTLRLARHLGVHHARLQMKGCPSFDELFETLKLDLDRTVLPTLHAAASSACKTAFLAGLQQLETPLVLGIDTFEQQASTDVADWVEAQLLARVERAQGLVIVLSGQKVPDRTKHAWGHLAVAFELPPIRDVKHWHSYARRILGSTAVKREHVEMLLHVSKGDPGTTSNSLRTFSTASRTTGHLTP